MKILIATISIFLLSVISSSTGKTLILINQNDRDITGCVECRGAKKCIAPGNETASIQLSNNATEQMVCMGRYDQLSYGGGYGPPSYTVYDSRGDFEKFKNQIIVMVNDTSFYRSNEEDENNWEQIPPHYWY